MAASRGGEPPRSDALHRYAVQPMRRRGAGAVVNVASTAGLGSGQHDAPEYAAAKAGVIRLSSALAAVAEEANIRVNLPLSGLGGHPRHAL
jgi:NAD(P)-dependent dehydrogenase (short-subunit alcohol dehydrogenase family)